MQKLPPSSANLWSKCPASFKTSNKSERNETSPAAKLGSKGHKIAAERLSFIYYQKPISYTEILEKDYMDAIGYYIEEVLKVCHTRPVIEHLLAAFGGISHGIPDLFWMDTKAGILHVFELKLGVSPVEVEWNWQLIIYAYRLYKEYGWKEAKLHVIQPRKWIAEDKHLTWSIYENQLDEINRKLNEMVLAAFQEIPVVKTGSHCHFCDGKYYCDAYKRKVATLYDISGDYNPESNYSGVELAFLLRDVSRTIEELKAYKDSIELQIKSDLRNGKPVPGFLIKPSQKMTWINSDSLPDDFYTKKPLTPLQAKKAGHDVTDMVEINNIFQVVEADPEKAFKNLK